jgi:succinyl-CoA synthetase alpha subunit
MSILLNETSKVFVQGITGKEGQKAVQAMIDYHTTVIGGVTPGKGGGVVVDKPVFNSVNELVDSLCQGNVSQLIGAVYVPPFAAKAAILEAIDADIKLVNVIVERMPLKDVAYCLAAAREKKIRIIGPSSLGFIVPGVGRVAVVGGPLVEEIFRTGNVGIISRSGGMTNELAWQVRKAGYGQSAAVHVGGDVLMGTTYADVLRMFQADGQTKAVIIFGEHGGTYEFEIVEAMREKSFNKPVAIYIGGEFASFFPEGVSIGHAGAIVEHGMGAKEKKDALQSVGALIAQNYEDLVELVKPFIT